MMLERERDGEVEREKRDLLLIYTVIFYWVVYIIIIGCVLKIRNEM